MGVRETPLLRAEDDAKLVGMKHWSVNEATARAVLDTMLAGVSYLL